MLGSIEGVHYQHINVLTYNHRSGMLASIYFLFPGNEKVRPPKELCGQMANGEWTCDLRIAGSSPGHIITLCA